MDVHEILDRIDYELVLGASSEHAARLALRLVVYRCHDLLLVMDLHGFTEACEAIFTTATLDQLTLDLEGTS